MDFTRQIETNRRILINDILRRLDAALGPFRIALDTFLATLFQARLPAGWRRQWHTFVATQATAGFAVEPHSIREMEQWIEAWARFCDLLPEPMQRAAPQTTVHQRDDDEGTDDEIDAGQPQAGVSQRAARRGKKKRRPNRVNWRYRPSAATVFFNAKLAKAQGHLDEIKRLLEGLGHKLDNAELDEAVEVETVADSIDVLIFQYNDALESAQDAWLRDDLPRSHFNRIRDLQTMTAVGLPLFTDEGQQLRMLTQGHRINRRLHGLDAAMDRFVFAVKVVDTTSTVVSIVAGGGVAVVLVKQGGKQTVKKMAASAIGAMAAETIAVAGLQYAGVSEQTIRGAQLAAAVVKFVLLRRLTRAPGATPAPKPTSPKPAPPTKTPPKPPRGKPARSKKSRTKKTPRKRTVSVPPSAVGRVHRNSLSSPRTTYLYRLEDADGNLLKWGATQDLGKRYSKSFLEGKKLKKVASGARADIIRTERGLVETQPGPLNFERWAGSRFGEQP